MIKINSVKCSHFRLFKDAEVSFEDRAGIYNLIGSSDTEFGDSNSSGKTSLSLLLEQALFGENRLSITQANLAHAYSKAKPLIEVDFNVADERYFFVQDYHKSVTELYKDGVKQDIKGKTNIIKLVQESFGVNTKVLMQLMYISGKTDLFFTQADPKSQYSLLVSLLNLEFIEKYAKDSADRLTGLKAEYQSCKRQIETIRHSIENLQIQLQEMPEVDDRDFAKDLEALKDERQAVASTLPPHQKKLEALRDKHSEHKAAHGVMLAQLSAIAKKIKEAKELDQPECPTCGQPLPEGLKQLATDYEKEQAELKAVFDANVEKHRETKTEQQKQQKYVDELQGEVVRLDYEIKKMSEYEIEQSKAQAQAKYREVLEGQVLSLTSQLVDVQQLQDSTEEKIYCFELLKACAGPKGFVNDRIRLFVKLFNQHLVQLSSELTKGDLILKIEEVKEKTYALRVYDGEASFDYNDLSEGLAARVKIVALLALTEVIEVLSGISLNVLFIDELTAALDQTGFAAIEELLDSVKERFPDKLIFVVSHEKKLVKVDGTLLVERKNNESTIRYL